MLTVHYAGCLTRVTLSSVITQALLGGDRIAIEELCVSFVLCSHK
jgi:hypothetical protein